MPIFSRRDGKLVPHLHDVHRMLPYLLPTRTESIVFHEELLDVTAALAFIDSWNAEHAVELKISIFHILLASFARALVARPGLDRFVSGSRIYQHNESHISFVIKKEFADGAAEATVKLKIIPNESFADTVLRIHNLVNGGRNDNDGPVEQELKILLALPSFMLRLLMRVVRLLDSWNMLPWFLVRNDLFYASIFVANLGSLGIDRVFHHLYEYGTVSLFAAIGAVKKTVFVGPGDQPVVRPGLSLRWSFDERINDGHYCFESLAIARRCVEDPQSLLGAWPEVQSAGPSYKQRLIAKESGNNAA